MSPTFSVLVRCAHRGGRNNAAGLRRDCSYSSAARRRGRIEGTIEAGGADFQILRRDDATELEARYTILTSRQARGIYVVNNGICATDQSTVMDALGARRKGRSRSSSTFGQSPRFETGAPEFAWLTQRIFVSIRPASSGSCRNPMSMNSPDVDTATRLARTIRPDRAFTADQSDAIESAHCPQRRSVRAFLANACFARDRRTHILDVAARAPSGTNMQPWRAHVLAGVDARDKPRPRGHKGVSEDVTPGDAREPNMQILSLTNSSEPLSSRGDARSGFDMYGAA